MTKEFDIEIKIIKNLCSENQDIYFFEDSSLSSEDMKLLIKKLSEQIDNYYFDSEKVGKITIKSKNISIN